VKALGVGFTPIIVRKVLGLEDLRGKSFAVDANNYLYQFLSVIRTRNGSPLKDSEGNVTSHLTGLVFRTTRLMVDYGLDLFFVFDGRPPLLKKDEIKRRRRERERAFKDWREALKNRDYSRAFSKAVAASRLTKVMIEDAKKLLRILGIPFVQAPSEAEAQAAFMVKRGDVWAASSKDYDTLLFGATRLLRFLTIYGKEYLPSKGTARPLKPELIELSSLLSHHGITRRQLVDLAILIGTDFNEGIKGVGPKTALKLIKKFERIENLPSEYLSAVPSYNDVRKIYLSPEVTKEYDLKYNPFNGAELCDFLCTQRDFARNRVEIVIRRMGRFHNSGKQLNLERWLKKRS